MKDALLNGEKVTIKPIRVNRTSELSAESGGQAYLASNGDIVFTHKIDLVVPVEGGVIGENKEIKGHEELTHHFPAGTPNHEVLEYEEL